MRIILIYVRGKPTTEPFRRRPVCSPLPLPSSTRYFSLVLSPRQTGGVFGTPVASVSLPYKLFGSHRCVLYASNFPFLNFFFFRSYYKKNYIVPEEETRSARTSVSQSSVRVCPKNYVNPPRRRTSLIDVLTKAYYYHFIFSARARTRFRGARLFFLSPHPLLQVSRDKRVRAALLLLLRRVRAGKITAKQTNNLYRKEACYIKHEWCVCVFFFQLLI